MQLMIDTQFETAASLRTTIKVLQLLLADAETAETRKHVVDTSEYLAEARERLAEAREHLADAPKVVVPFPPPPPPAPISTNFVPTPPLITPTLFAERDKAGLPWDERIHQKGKNLKKDGTWKLKKGLDQALVSSVIAELVGRGLTMPPPSSAPEPDPRAVFGANPGSVPIPPPPAPPASDPAPTIPTPGGITYRELAAKIISGINTGKLTHDVVNQIILGAGAPSLQALNGMPNLIPQVNAQLDASLAV